MSSPIIGKVYEDEHGLPVYIVSGSYYGSYNRISNFWKWKPVNKDGSLGETISGYWRWGTKEMKAIIITTVKLDTR